MNSPHLPVLYQQILEVLQPQPGGCYIDGTLGAGGHASGILQASSPSGELLGIDLDPQAIAIAREKLKEYGTRAHIVHGSYTTMHLAARQLGWDAVEGILLDVGASSMQFDIPERGFSFLEDAPLDMRFSLDAHLTAADLVNDLPEDELANLIYEYGEERASRRIARAILAARPLHTTTELAAVVEKSVPPQKGRKSHLHPATRTFQALRIAVNDELNNIRDVLPKAVELLAPGGRLAIISFHSLEDRIAKEYFRLESKDCICPPERLICDCGHRALIRQITKKPLGPTTQEVLGNPRSRSSRLRVVEKLPRFEG